jgi:hypothetical protein
MQHSAIFEIQAGPSDREIFLHSSLFDTWGKYCNEKSMEIRKPGK